MILQEIANTDDASYEYQEMQTDDPLTQDHVEVMDLPTMTPKVMHSEYFQ